MSDEQNIPGVPEGYRITGLIARQTDTTTGPHPGVYYEAILERIPKPKKQIIIAEFVAPDVVRFGTSWKCFLEYPDPDRFTNHRRAAYAQRIEERDV